MNIKRWIARREPQWEQLDQILQQVEKKGIASLQVAEVKELASLYRAVTADLARAQTAQVGQVVIQYLQTLTTRAYSQIYQGTRRQDWQQVVTFYQWDFPATVQRNAIYILTATALFVLGGLVGWWGSWHDPAFLGLVVPEELINSVREERQLWMGSILGLEPLASAGLMINNLSVAFLAIFSGVTMFLPEQGMITPPGTFTTFLLFSNGLLLGAIATLVAQAHLAWPFWAFVFPHGALELPAIFLAGGGGLLLARAILFPGRYQRRDALKVYGLEAVQLVYGVLPLLVMAGVIEGFFSPSPLVPDVVKYGVGITLLSVLIRYCLRRPPGNLDLEV